LYLGKIQEAEEENLPRKEQEGLQGTVMGALGLPGPSRV